MDNTTPRKPNPRRKKVKRIKRIIRTYTPVAIALVLVVLFIIFAAGSVKRANAKREEARLESIAIEESLAKLQYDLGEEAKELVREAQKLSASCNYDEAIALLDTFSGNPDDFEVLQLARSTFEAEKDALVSVGDVTKIKCLSFANILWDWTNYTGNSSYNSEDRAYITFEEFQRILQELYDNDYMLVDIYDLFETTVDENGNTIIVQKDLRLPSWKKPLMLIATQPTGYDVKFIYDEQYDLLMNEYTNESLQVLSPAEFVTLLEEFLLKHPDFSYQGSRAVLSLTAHNGLFGYELNQTAEITKIAKVLQDKGYILSCNTYGNVSYGNKHKLAEIQEDISSWNVTVAPLIGQTDILVYAKSSDIEDTKEPYKSDKYELLSDAGFRYYFGVCYNSDPWMSISDESIRIGRIMVTYNLLKENPDLYAGLFNAANILQ